MTLVPLIISWLSLSEDPDHNPKKTVQPRDAFEDIAFKPVWKCQILNQIVESHLFTSFWNRYHQWLSDIELIQRSALSASYPSVNPSFIAGKQSGVGNCHETGGHRKKAFFKSIVYDSIPSIYRFNSPMGWRPLACKRKWGVLTDRFSPCTIYIIASLIYSATKW